MMPLAWVSVFANIRWNTHSKYIDRKGFIETCIFRDRSCIHLLIFTGIMALFAIISSEACDRIPTVEQQDFCSAQNGKLVNNENAYAKPTFIRAREMFAILARLSSLQISVADGRVELQN